jgi:glycosyltransferase involved in cell wall biosynthesis
VSRVKKLIIQIPCFNEEASLPVALADLPRHVPGFDVVEWLIIDDGSSDRTVEAARLHGVDHVVQLPYNQGLARAFLAGIEACLRLKADVIVNTDADNQYAAKDIPRLVGPILRHEADIVVGARPITSIQHFSVLKKILQRLGSWTVRTISGASISDAPSGFRAFSSEAAMQLRVWGRYTYTLETVIQAGAIGLRVRSVPIGVNPDLRPSRLVKSIGNYVLRSTVTIFRMFLLYRPLQFFSMLAAICFVLSLLLFARWTYLNVFEYPITGRLHLPSLIAGAILFILSAQMWLFGLVAELLTVNRRLLEEIRVEQRRIAFTRDESPVNSHLQGFAAAMPTEARTSSTTAPHPPQL